MRNMKALSVVTLLVGSLAACGGDSSPAAPTTAVVAAPTPAPCTQSLLLEGSGSLPARTVDQETVSVASAGRLDVTLDWTFAASPIGLYVVQGACSIEQFNARTCNFLARSESGAKPRKLSVSGIAPGSYSILIANGATQSESLSLQVFLSSSTCPAIASAHGAVTSQVEAQVVAQIRGVLKRR